MATEDDNLISSLDERIRKISREVLEQELGKENWPTTSLLADAEARTIQQLLQRIMSKEFISAKEAAILKEGAAISNPCVKISKKVREKIPARNKRDRFMSLEEEQKLFTKGLVGRCERIRPAVTLGIHLGTRLGELAAIKRDEVNLSENSFIVMLRSKGQDLKVEVRPNHVLIPKSKNGKPRTIPLSSVARNVFADLLSDESTSEYVFANPDTNRPYTDIGKLFAKACADAGIEDLTFHDLRHTFASRLREAGVDAITRRDLLGHSTVQMSDDYTHSSTESRLRAVQSIADYRKQDYSKITANDDSEVRLQIAS